MISATECEKRYPRDSLGVFCLRVSSSLYIDSALFRGVGASANASRSGTRPNACFVVDTNKGTARLEITRPVRAGGEIFVSYGPSYWKFARLSSHSTNDVPEWEWDLSDPFMPNLSVPRVLPVAVSVAPAQNSVAVTLRVPHCRSYNLQNRLSLFLKRPLLLPKLKSSPLWSWPSFPLISIPKSRRSVEFWQSTLTNKPGPSAVFFGPLPRPVPRPKVKKLLLTYETKFKLVRPLGPPSIVLPRPPLLNTSIFPLVRSRPIRPPSKAQLSCAM